MTAPTPGEGVKPPSEGTPPVTGFPQVDQATARLADLADLPLTEHQDRLAAAQQALQHALQDEAPPVPGVPREPDRPPRP